MSNGVALYVPRIRGTANLVHKLNHDRASIAVDDTGLVVSHKGVNLRLVDQTNGHTMAGAVTLSSTLNVTGAAVLSSTLAVTSTSAFTGAATFSAAINQAGSNGQNLAVSYLTELTTIADAASSSTTIQLPAHAIILAVPVRVTVVIPTASNFTVGDAGSAARYNTGSNVAVAANTTNVGTKAGAYYNASAASVILTPDMTPADATGRVRVTIYYIALTAPTS